MITIDNRCAVLLAYELGEVYAAQVTTFIRQERLFTARISAFHLSHIRSGVFAVDSIDEDNAGIAILPGSFDDQLEDLPCAQQADRLAGAGIAQRVILIPLYRLHELFR